MKGEVRDEPDSHASIITNERPAADVRDPALYKYHIRHSGPDPESSKNKYRRALRATGYRPSPV
jgi:hypothetical protein